jgi:hypothetical protein
MDSLSYERKAWSGLVGIVRLQYLQPAAKIDEIVVRRQLSPHVEKV